MFVLVKLSGTRSFSPNHCKEVGAEEAAPLFPKATMALHHLYNIWVDKDAPAYGPSSNSWGLYTNQELHLSSMAWADKVLSKLQPKCCAHPTCLKAVFQDLPGNTRRSTIRSRRNLRRGSKGIRRGTWPGGHRGCTTQCWPTSRRWPRSWASRPRSGWWHSGSSPLRRGAGRRRPDKQRNSTATTGLELLLFYHQVPICCLQWSFFSFVSL